MTRDEILAALRPFALFADAFDPDEGDDLQKLYGDTRNTIGDLRRARRVYEALKSETREPSGIVDARAARKGETA